LENTPPLRRRGITNVTWGENKKMGKERKKEERTEENLN
jgi:hypothetical protein